VRQRQHLLLPPLSKQLEPLKQHRLIQVQLHGLQQQQFLSACSSSSSWWQWCEKSNTVQLCPAAHSFATQRSPWRVLKLATAEAVEEVKQS